MTDSVSITVVDLLTGRHELYMENTFKEFFAPTLMSGLSQSLNFGRAHVSIISAGYTGSDIKATLQYLQSSLGKPDEKKTPQSNSFQESVFADDTMACITSEFPSIFNTLLHNIHGMQHLVSTSDCVDS